MKSPGLLIAAVLLAVLSGLVYWTKKHKESAASKPPADAAPKILTLDEKQVDELRIQKGAAEPIVVTRLADRWDITKPQPFPADQETVKTLVSAAATLTSDQLIDAKPSNLGPFGLDQPNGRVSVHLKGGKTSTLLFGSDTPAGGAVYVKLEGDPRVFSVAGFTRTGLEKSLDDLRDKRLLTFNQEKISRIELAGKGPAIEFGKNAQGDWQILKPAPMRADAVPVDDVVRKLAEARMDLAGSGTDATAKFASAPKIAVASITDSSGTQTLELRQDKDKNTYAKSSVVPGIYKVGADVADSLAKPLNDFRNKKLFDFGFSELAQVTVGGVHYAKSGEKWFANGKEMDPTTVSALIEKLRDLSATSFGEKAEGSPLLAISTVSQDKKRTEKVTITRQGSNTFAVRGGEPSVYILENTAADDLTKASAAIKPVAAKAAKK